MNSENPYAPTGVHLADTVSAATARSIEYRNTYWDLVRFHAVHQFLSPLLQFFYVGLAALFFRFGISWQLGVWGALAMALVMYAMMWGVQFVFNALYAISRKNHSFLTTHVVELRDDALFEETQYGRFHFHWNGLLKVVRRPGFIAVYISPFQAHIIPLRAFASPAAADAFYRQVKARIQTDS